MPLCAVPGCGVKLHKANRSGICKNHVHWIGYCMCWKCQAKTQGHEGKIALDKQFKLPKWRGARTSLLHLQQAKANERAAKRPITLPKAPWEDRDD